jgi:hypothetical protein
MVPCRIDVETLTFHAWKKVNIAKRACGEFGARSSAYRAGGLWSAGGRQFPNRCSEDIDDAEQFG